jgi:hypothetical protein
MKRVERRADNSTQAAFLTLKSPNRARHSAYAARGTPNRGRTAVTIRADEAISGRSVSGVAGRTRRKMGCTPLARGSTPMISLSRSKETDRARCAPGGTNTRRSQCAQPRGVPRSLSAAISGPVQAGQSNNRSMNDVSAASNRAIPLNKAVSMPAPGYSLHCQRSCDLAGRCHTSIDAPSLPASYLTPAAPARPRR